MLVTLQRCNASFDPRMISWLHADLAILFLGLSIGLAVAMTASGSLAQRKAAWLLVVATTLQAVIGYTQYFTNLPWVLVAFHVTGAVVLWLAVLNVRYSVRPLN